MEYLTREAEEIAIETFNNTMLIKSVFEWIGMLDLKREDSMRCVARSQRRDEVRRKEEPARPTGNSLFGKIKVKEYLSCIYKYK